MSTEHSPVVAVFSPVSGRREPIEFGLAASRLTGAPLIVAVVRGGGAETDAGTLEHLHALGAAAEVREFAARTEAKALESAREELQPELIVLESAHRRDLSEAILGSTLERVIHESTCPVAVVPAGYERPEAGLQVVGAAYAPTEEGREALQSAVAIVRAGGVRLRAILVLDPAEAGENAPGLLAAQHRETAPAAAAHGRAGLRDRAELEAAVAELGVPAETDVLFGDPATSLVDASREVDLLVIGSRARGPRQAVLLGSVSRKVAEQAACPVLIVPRAAAGATEAALADAPAAAE